MDTRHSPAKSAPTLAELFPELSPEDLEEAAYRIDRYLTIGLAIVERFEVDSAKDSGAAK